MGAVREYLLQIVAVCMIAAIGSSVVKNRMVGKIVRLVSGLLILVVVIAPLSKVDISRLPDYFDTEPQLDQNAYHEAFRQQVQKATQTHIERIALEYGCSIQTDVTVSDDEVPIPVGIVIIGAPNAQQMLQISEYIKTQLGIPMEQQDWRMING